ncbi:MAG TPA: aldo/keto reductase [Fimbriimonadaceae bacterium]|nr:aldo/keto reductase [Fimbriimonadaceae bacterium]
MEYRSLGRTGVQVSAACLGTMTFGWDPEDWGSYEQAAIEIVHKALDLGINFFDTADVYARGESERILGKALALEQTRDRVVLATKCHAKMSDTDPNMWGNSRRHVIEACEASLVRLGTDRIDLFQIHRPQPSIPIDETLRGLDHLVRSGKVRYIGCSTFAAWQICEAHYVARAIGTDSFVTEQPPYNLLDRRIERELLPFCRTYDYAVIPWSPLAGGMLSGKYLDAKPEEGRYAKSDPGKRLEKLPGEKLKALQQVAAEAGVTMTTLSLAWVSNQPGITAPIIGARSTAQLEESVNACLIQLDPDVLKKIDEIFPPASHHVDYYSASFGPNARV